VQSPKPPTPSAVGRHPPSGFSLFNIFKRDYERYEGVPPINIYLLKLLFALMFIFLTYDSWAHVFRHTGPWDPANSAAWFMWGSCGVIAVIGIIRPLKMLPIVLFEIVYKTAWLIVVGWPLSRQNQLAGTPAGAMAHNFMLVILPIVAMPWRYFFRSYIMDKRAA
jgi:hypothetical protein